MNFDLLIQCYQSDIDRLDAIIEASWYLAQLSSTNNDDIDLLKYIENCKKEKQKTQAKLLGLLNLIEEQQNDSPRYRHHYDPNVCTFLGQYQNFDLYYCRRYGPFIAVICGNTQAYCYTYPATGSPAPTAKPLVEAIQRAVKHSFLPRNY